MTGRVPGRAPNSIGTSVYLENMASIGVPTPDLASTVDRVCEIAECDSTIVLEKRLVAVYTFEQMLRVHKASGCEVLVVDAEGHDCSILRSMIAACRWGGVPWPYAIRFETRGHADSREGAGAEDGMVRRLQWHSYLLLAVNGDTTLVHSHSLRRLWHLREWADRHFTLTCYRCRRQLQPSARGFGHDVGSGFSQWRGTAEDRELGKAPYRYWCCRSCSAKSSN